MARTVRHPRADSCIGADATLGIVHTGLASINNPKNGEVAVVFAVVICAFVSGICVGMLSVYGLLPFVRHDLRRNGAFVLILLAVVFGVIAIGGGIEDRERHDELTDYLREHKVYYPPWLELD